MILIFRNRFAVVCLFLSLLSGAAQSQNLTTYINSVIPSSGLNLTLNSVTLFNTVTSGNLNAMRDSAFYNWVYPNGTVSGEDATVSNVYKMGEQSGLDTAIVSAHYAFLSAGAKSIQVGDKLYRCSYTLIDNTYGTFNFTTLGYEDASGNTKFEPFISMCPVHFSDYIKVTKPGGAHDVEFEVKNGFGSVCASGWGDCVVTCSGNTVVDCFGLVGGDACFLWEYEITKDCATVGNCCRCIFRFGFANGFSSVGVGVDGVSIELSGSFGWKGSTESVVKRCCPTGAVVAMNFAPQTSGTTATLYSVSTVSESVGWVCGTSATVLRTIDGGNTWTNASGTGLSGDIYNIYGIDMNTAFCTSTPASVTFIYKTINGGVTWAPVYNQPNGFINTIQMITPTMGFALGDPVDGKWTVLRTVNSGNTWQRIPTEPVQSGAQNSWNNSFKIIGNHMWFGTSTQEVYHSFDLGITWNSAPTPGLVNSYAVQFNSMVTGLAGGNGMVHTTNSGMNYSHSAMPPSLSDVFGIAGSGPEWWSVGNNQTVYMSANNGARWQSVYTHTLDGSSGIYLGAIDLDETGSYGWIVGSDGVIIKAGSLSQEASVNLSAFIEGFFNPMSNTQIGDTITAYLRNTTSPYAKVDSAMSYLNSNGIADLNFPHAPTGNYYLVLKHRNSIETWSSSGVAITIGSVVNYDFTISSAQAYGSNLKLKGTKWCIYGGDVNQDESIDATDLSLIDNDANNFAVGYLDTDVTGDNSVDGSDYALADNNATNFISVIRP